MKWWQGIIVGLAVAAAAVVGYLIGHSGAKEPPVTQITEKVDTLYVYDTITATKPIYIDRVKLDSVIVPVTDTIRMQDTLYVYLEREQVQWQDSLCRVYASGIEPQVDSVMHFTRETIVTKEIRIPVKVKSRWGVGVQAGYGVGIADKRVMMTPYIGVGVSYNIIAW